MSATSSADPRVIRSRAAAVDAARTLFLRNGYTATTMDAIADQAGLTKRTLYNHYAEKEQLFNEVVAEVMVYAETFARELPDAFSAALDEDNMKSRLDELGQRLALAIVRPEVVALRRLLISESGTFPQLARVYYERAPGQVLETLASEFERLARAGMLRVDKPQIAAEQFAYLIVGQPLDRAMLLGSLPTEAQVLDSAHEGVETFLARYAPP